jgi:hypothetical protein
LKAANFHAKIIIKSKDQFQISEEYNNASGMDVQVGWSISV